MTRRFITSVPGLSDPPSPISQAVVVGSHCYVSGQLSVEPDGTFAAGSAAAEAERSFRNVFAVLAAAGFTPADIVYVDIAFVDLADVPAVNAVYAALFPEARQASRQSAAPSE
jgi:2-iminobutanoate/2-iminopropanoate deaminase